ncbi:MAG: thioredoxin domain-containing protein, partial [bacterium]
VESVSVDKSKSTIGADIVLIATGIVPDTALAGKAGIEIGELGGVSTDDRQRPRMDGKLLEDVYALGDCVEVKNKLTGRNTLSPLTETAIVQARIVSLDIMHKKVKLVSEVKKGCVCSALTVVGNLQIGMTGLTTSEAEKAGIQPRVVQVSGWSKEVYFPGKTKKHIKLLLDGDRLIGAQVIGTEGVRGLINEINAFIHASSRVGDIVYRQRGYTPALSSSPDLLMRALDAPTVEEIAREYDGKLKVCKLNVDEGRNTAAQYGIMSIPSLLIFKNGQVVEQVVGVVPKETLEDKIKPHIGE